jgi:hypothetical protein
MDEDWTSTKTKQAEHNQENKHLNEIKYRKLKWQVKLANVHELDMLQKRCLRTQEKEKNMKTGSEDKIQSNSVAQATHHESSAADSGRVGGASGVEFS